MLEPNVLFKEFRFRSCLAQTQMEQLEEKVQEFRSFVKKAEERLQRIHGEAKIVKEQARLLMGNGDCSVCFTRKTEGRKIGSATRSAIPPQIVHEVRMLETQPLGAALAEPALTAPAPSASFYPNRSVLCNPCRRRCGP
jgi:hypothetical protein